MYFSISFPVASRTLFSVSFDRIGEFPDPSAASRSVIDTECTSEENGVANEAI